MNEDLKNGLRFPLEYFYPSSDGAIPVRAGLELSLAIRGDSDWIKIFEVGSRSTFQIQIFEVVACLAVQYFYLG